jgi:hypothetical protein
MIKQAADQIQTKLRDHSSKFAEAKARVEQLHKNGELTEAQVCKTRLRPETARSAIQFYRLRERAAKTQPR